MDTFQHLIPFKILFQIPFVYYFYIMCICFSYEFWLDVPGDVPTNLLLSEVQNLRMSTKSCRKASMNYWQRLVGDSSNHQGLWQMK